MDMTLKYIDQLLDKYSLRLIQCVEADAPETSSAAVSKTKRAYAKKLLKEKRDRVGRKDISSTVIRNSSLLYILYFKAKFVHS